MLKKSWKRIVSIILIVALLISTFPTVVSAEDSLPENPECDAQSGMSEIYEYQAYDIGKAGTAYLNTYLAAIHLRRSDLSLGGNRLPVTIEFYYDAENLQETGSTETNPYGCGWASAYSQILRFDSGSNRYAYKNENGTWVYFTNSGTATESNEEIWAEQTTYGIGATGAELHKPAAAAQTDYANICIVCDDVRHSFDTSGRLVGLSSSANQVTITYVAGSLYKIQQITDAVGRKFRFSMGNTNRRKPGNDAAVFRNPG